MGSPITVSSAPSIAFGGAIPNGYVLTYNFDTSWAKVIGPLNP